MAWTQADLERLEKAYATGTLKVRVGDKETVFASADDLLSRIQMVRRALFTSPVNRKVRLVGFNRMS